MAANLPNTVGSDFMSAVSTHLQRLQATGPQAVPAGVDTSRVATAAEFIKTQMANFFSGL
jgi:hypothetical protein